ncbi:hypothetical protein C3747_84g39 [Trypanosoma cruzi]|uniref:Uncharacterized protein n=2 Tax=Trypanosoma cruzi TaxID=5693 RepID=Q4DZF0_TRYCC|nr:hypothetical protein, conserved [Trypanosoma cruzi]EAN97903.1 hypothetical protein, conserved [Trypanosoma cruzi]PWV08912.1 hypothetical protein C3747_84g39 [Trypanosoma cruzi]RNC60052.1 hypothetical protein TcCL_ESM02268 [Trypanosoma cruzi]|eukprot:XP_819754.1 hypothetical protein [Trypanosoma cruzi strain CL Brener]
MIRVVAPTEGVLQEMLLLELQGKVSIPPKLVREASEKQQKQGFFSGVRQPRDAEESLAQAEVSDGALGQETVVEVPLGHIDDDPRNKKRCSLRIGTLLVEGSRGQFGEPLLVLRQRKSQPCQQPQHGAQKSPLSSSPSLPSARCCLLQEWLAEHPEEMTLDAASASVDTNEMPTKTYELVGIVERYVHLNSKPLRTSL